MNRARISTALAVVIALLAAAGFAGDLYRHDVPVPTTIVGTAAVLLVVFWLAELMLDSLLARGVRNRPERGEES